MKIDRKSLTYRLIVPVFLIFLSIAAALIISINTIANHIIDEFVWHEISSHVSETMRIIEVAQSDLTTARLLDNPSVVEAKKMLVREAISLSWQRRVVSGVLVDEDGRVIFSNLEPEIIKQLPLSRESGHIRLELEEGELHGELVNYPAWRWRIFVGTKTLAQARVRKEVYYLIPLLVLGLVLMLMAFTVILRRNLHAPVQSLVSAIGTVQSLSQTGITELDRIGNAMNETMRHLKARTEELAAELEERKRAESALQQSEERYRTTLMSVGDGVISTDARGQVMLMNAVAAALTGWTAEEAVGRPLDEVFCIVNEETRLRVKNPAEEVLREGLVVGLANHTVLISRNGSECAIADAGAPIRDSEGGISGVVLVFRDQTEERAAQDSLRAEKNKSEAILAAMGDGVSIQDLNYRILYQNDVHKRFVGSHAGEYCFRAYEAKEAVCEGCPVALTFSDGMVHLVLRTVHMPGGIRYFEITSSPLRDASGEIIAGIEVVRDVTVQRHSEEQLRQAQKMDSIGQLAGGIAHDFNNVMTAIIGYASLLEIKLRDNEQLRPYVAHILESSERASGLTRSLLAFSRKQSLEMKPVNLNELACGFRNIMSRLIGEDIALELKCSSEELVVDADKGQLEQVLMNLVTNARDAMPKGGRIGICTEHVVMDRDMGDIKKGAYAVVVFSDNGAGIDPKVQEHIFEPFFTTKEVGKGTGLGLAVVYGIIHKHGGTIHLYSEPGQGTTFRIYLPVSETAAAEKAETEILEVPHGTETILLVEDNEETRWVAREILEEFGYSVIEAVDGEDAVTVFIANQDRIQLVLSDLVMPKKNGREACDEIRKLRPEVKIILMSGYTADIINTKGSFDTGMNFISKPLNPSTLLNKIREALAS